jgi:UPF0176 protein
MEGCCSNHCREQLHLPVEERRRLRKGVNKGQMIFNKSRNNPLLRNRRVAGS